MRLFALLLILLMAHSAAADTIQLRCSLDENGTMQIDDIIFLTGSPLPLSQVGDYCFSLTDLDTPKKIGEDCFEPNFILRGKRNVIFEALSLMWMGHKPQHKEMSQDWEIYNTRIYRLIEFEYTGYSKAKLDLKIENGQTQSQILIFCKSDGVCEGLENHMTCPLDCASSIADSFCDGKEDGGCDPDCKPQQDLDCETGTCDGFMDGICDPDCAGYSQDPDCPCGDGYCDLKTESITSCHTDCISCSPSGGCKYNHYCAVGSVCRPKMSSGTCKAAAQCMSDYCISGNCLPFNPMALSSAIIILCGFLLFFARLIVIWKKGETSAVGAMIGQAYAICGLIYLSLLFSPSRLVRLETMGGLAGLVTLLFIPLAYCLLVVDRLLPANMVSEVSYSTVFVLVCSFIVVLWTAFGSVIAVWTQRIHKRWIKLVYKIKIKRMGKKII